MLTIAPLRSIPNDLDRRWMSDEYFDLIVWYDPDERIDGFQLCYDQPGRERALTWTREHGYTHVIIDDGESKPTANRTPVLADDPAFAREQVKAEFALRGAALPEEIRTLITARIDGYGKTGQAGERNK